MSGQSTPLNYATPEQLDQIAKGDGQLLIRLDERWLWCKECDTQFAVEFVNADLKRFYDFHAAIHARQKGENK